VVGSAFIRLAQDGDRASGASTPGSATGPVRGALLSGGDVVGSSLDVNSRPATTTPTASSDTSPTATRTAAGEN
jgi:hypothetical protein